MDALRRGMLRAADQVTLAGLHAGKFYGFLGSGRELVQIQDEMSGPVAHFPDASDEGWRAFSVPLPFGAIFRHAAAGPLSRVALWQVSEPAEQVLGDLEDRRDEIRFTQKADGVREAELPDHVSLRVNGHEPGMTLMVVKQERDAGVLPDVIRARLTGWKEGR